MGGDDVLVDTPDDSDFGKVRISRERNDSLLLLGREQIGVYGKEDPLTLETSGTLIRISTIAIKEDMDGSVVSRLSFVRSYVLHRDPMTSLEVRGQLAHRPAKRL